LNEEKLNKLKSSEPLTTDEQILQYQQNKENLKSLQQGIVLSIKKVL